MKGHIQTGTVEGTGAAINVETGFNPDYVKVFNYDDAGALAPSLEWFSGMPDASAIKTLSIVDSGTTALKSTALITSLGISAYAGASGANAKGFTIGADTDVNVSAETLYWIAIKNGL